MHAGPSPEPGPIPAGGLAGPAPTEPVAGKAGPPEVVPAVVTAPPGAKPKPAGEFTKVKNPLQIVLRSNIYSVAAGARAGLSPGMELKVVGAARSDGQRKVLGRAKVQEVFPKKAVLILDERASKAGGDRFVAMLTEVPDESSEAETPPAPPVPPPPSAAPAAKRISVGVRQTGLLGINEIDRTFIVYNSEGKPLSHCKATIHRRGQYVFPYLRIKDNKVKQGQFKPHADAPTVPQGKMLIECDEGRVEAEIQS